MNAWTEYDPANPPPEPGVGTWMRDRYGATTMRQESGWGQPGVMPLGRWTVMWATRGPYVECGPWGTDLPASAPAVDETTTEGMTDVRTLLETIATSKEFTADIARAIPETLEVIGDILSVYARRPAHTHTQMKRDTIPADPIRPRPTGTPADSETKAAETIVHNGITYVPAFKLSDSRGAHERAVEVGRLHAARANEYADRIRELETQLTRTNDAIVTARANETRADERANRLQFAAVNARAILTEAIGDGIVAAEIDNEGEDGYDVDYRPFEYGDLVRPIFHPGTIGRVTYIDVNSKGRPYVIYFRNAKGDQFRYEEADVELVPLKDAPHAEIFDVGDAVTFRNNPPRDETGPIVGEITHVYDNRGTRMFAVDWENGAVDAYPVQVLTRYDK